MINKKIIKICLEFKQKKGNFIIEFINFYRFFDRGFKKNSIANHYKVKISKYLFFYD